MTTRSPKEEGVSEAVEAIFAVIDERASELLKLAFAEHADGPGDTTIPIPLLERIKAFDSVVEYAAIRAKVEPPKRALKETAFARLHKQFHGTGDADGDAPERRTRARKTPPANGAGHA